MRSLIAIEEPIAKGVIKFPVSKKLAEAFEHEASVFSSINPGIKLNFDKFAAKIISEIKSLNKQDTETKNELKTSE